MDNKWTDRLPNLMEGHTEAEPEGLWDAVQAGISPRKRRVAAGWWYAAGSLAAAAAVVLAVFLWPRQNAIQDGSPVPGDRLVENSVDVPEVSGGANITEGETPIAGEQNEAETHTETTQTPLGGQKRPVLHTQSLPAPVQGQNDPETHPEGAEKQVQGQDSPDSPLNNDEKPARKDDAETSPQKTTGSQMESIPEEWLRPVTVPSKQKKSGKVQLSVTSGGLLAQAGTINRNGFGLPDTPSGGNGPAAAPMPLFSSVHRNKASKTEARHWQNFRVGLLANYAFSERWSLESGLQYTSLQARVTTESGNSSVVTDTRFNYLGIPLNVQFKPLEISQFSVYLSAGPMYEFLLNGRERSQTFAGGLLSFEDEPQALDLKDHRWSLNAGVGLQWQPFRFGAFFVQPGVSWHIPGNEDAPETFYSTRPVAFDLIFGVRVLL